MIPRMAVLLLGCGLLLAGCYESQDLLLDRAAPRQPLRAGAYILAGDDGKVARLQLGLDPDGWYTLQQVEDGKVESTHKVLFNDLEKDAQRAVYSYASYDSREGAYVYGVLAIGADGHIARKNGDCSRIADAKFAIDAGAQKGVDVCQFWRNDRALDAALKALAANPKHWDQVDAE